MNKGEKLVGKENYDIWHRKVQLILQDMEVAEAITHVVQPPAPNAAGNSTQHRRDLEAYTAWKSKNSTARITLLSTMKNDLLCEFEEYETAYSLWIALKDKFGATSATKLRQLTIKFDTYKKRSNTTMRQHLR